MWLPAGEAFSKEEGRMPKEGDAVCLAAGKVDEKGELSPGRGYTVRWTITRKSTSDDEVNLNDARTGKEWILEVNGTSSGLSPDTEAEDNRDIRDLVVARMSAALCCVAVAKMAEEATDGVELQESPEALARRAAAKRRLEEKLKVLQEDGFAVSDDEPVVSGRNTDF